MQGDEDKIVPPEQSLVLWEAVKAKGLPTTLMMYKVKWGQGHLTLLHMLPTLYTGCAAEHYRSAAEHNRSHE